MRRAGCFCRFSFHFCVLVRVTFIEVCIPFEFRWIFPLVERASPHVFCVRRVFFMAQKTIRIPKSLVETLIHEARRRGYTSSSAFIREAIQHEVDRANGHSNELEERMAESYGRLAEEVSQLKTAQQAQFALVDALARMIFQSLPEPALENHDHALASAKQRHERLLRMAAHLMQGEVRNVFTELARHG